MKNFFTGFWAGFWGIKSGGQFVGKNPKLLLWCLLPILLNYLVFGTIFYVAGRFIPEIADAFLPAASNWFWSLLRFLLQGVGYVLVGLVSYFIFVPVAGLIASPFNDMLAEQVGILVTGKTPEGAGWKNFLPDALFSIKVEVKKLLLLLLLAAGTFLVGLVPVLQVVSPVVGVLVGIFYVSLEYLDYAMSHRKIPFGDRVAVLVTEQPGVTLGFGLPPYLIALIPVINVLIVPLVAPLLVVGGSVLYYERIQPKGHAAA